MADINDWLSRQSAAAARDYYGDSVHGSKAHTRLGTPRGSGPGRHRDESRPRSADAPEVVEKVIAAVRGEGGTPVRTRFRINSVDGSSTPSPVEDQRGRLEDAFAPRPSR